MLASIGNGPRNRDRQILRESIPTSDGFKKESIITVLRMKRSTFITTYLECYYLEHYESHGTFRFHKAGHDKAMW